MAQVIRSGWIPWTLTWRFMLIFTASILDWYFTRGLIHLDGFSAEANPILSHLIIQANHSWPIIVFKSVTLTALFLALEFGWKSGKITEKRLCMYCNIAMIFQIPITIYGGVLWASS